MTAAAQRRLRLHYRTASGARMAVCSIDLAAQRLQSAAGERSAVALYSAALFTAALLLFSLQPMVGKSLLPALGATPAIWNTCMVFFQAALLAGYALAHALGALPHPRLATLLHLAAVAGVLLLLPIPMGADVAPSADVNPALWLLLRLLVTVGAPFVIIATIAPLLQRQFATGGFRSSGDPYFLYRASNAGSLAALLAYPVLIEPLLPLAEQSRWWTLGFATLAALLAACALRSGAESAPLRPGASDDGSMPGAPTSAQRRAANLDAPGAIGARRMTAWVAWAALPSSLMLGVTSHVTTDLAAAPLLWVAPLALYLLTFILAFSPRAQPDAAWPRRALPFILLPMVAFHYCCPPGLTLWMLPLHIAAFFLMALACHQRLAADRPHPARLTTFYLCMSLGGVIGGAFNALVAPLVFSGVTEYPLALILGAFVMLSRPSTPPGAQRHAALREWLVAAGLALLVGGISAGGAALVRAQPGAPWLLGAAVALPMLLCFAGSARPAIFCLCIAALLAAGAWLPVLDRGRVLHTERNFFGVKRVIVERSGQYRFLMHGGTNHGAQALTGVRAEPITYYHSTGPIGDVFAQHPAPPGRRRIAVIGLGVGSLAAYARPGDDITFFEIDPAIERIAARREWFSFLAECRGAARVVIGDGRLRIAAAPRGSFDLIVLDAFSSDAIPAHLVTREAIAIYRGRLAPGGWLAMHISNHFLDLAPLARVLAADAEMECLLRDDAAVSAELLCAGKTASRWVVMAPGRQALAPLRALEGWLPPSDELAVPIWTDQSSNLLSLLRW
ncbi:MAG: fused MFS/spermidine synthase [Planctomycetia bacterium]|nr:MAG: fused MFS/spermidine synthase [Planctomycetia bacterium]